MHLLTRAIITETGVWVTRDSLVVSALDQQPRGRWFESSWLQRSRSNRGPVALCTLNLGLLNPLPPLGVGK